MLKQAAFGFVVGICVLRGLAGCGAAQVVECRVDAVKILPVDPDQVTVGDLRDVVSRLHACEARGDAGGR